MLYDLPILRPDDVEWLYAPNQVYAKRRTGDLSLQLIYPHMQVWPEKARLPLVVFIPGAAWYEQEMYSGIPQWARLAERGAVVAAVQVRPSTKACFPAQVDDVLDAIHHLVAQAERWHIDPARVYLMGQSSGGHIALMTLFTRMQQLADAPDFLLRGVIAQSAPTDLWRCGDTPSLELLGLEHLSDDPEKVHAASCSGYISREAPLPRILLMHGTEDDVVPIEHSMLLHRQLVLASKVVKFVRMNGAGHGGAAFWQNEVLDHVMGFIAEG